MTCSTETTSVENVRRATRGAAVALLMLLTLTACQSAFGPGRVRQEERNAYRQALALEETDPAGAARQLEAFLSTWPRSSHSSAA